MQKLRKGCPANARAVGPHACRTVRDGDTPPGPGGEYSSSYSSYERISDKLERWHGHHLDDTLVKLQALARFAADFGGEFRRIEAISKPAATLRVLDLQDATVREAVLETAASPERLYRDLGNDYDL